MTAGAAPQVDGREERKVVALESLRGEIVERLRAVAQLRDAAAQAATIKKAMETALFESASYQAAAERAKQLAAQLEIAEREAKTLTLEHFGAEPTNKKPVPGAGVAVSRKVEYDADRFFQWAKSKGLFLVPESLDTKALEKFLLGEPAIDVEYRLLEVPSVRLDGDLSAYLVAGGAQ